MSELVTFDPLHPHRPHDDWLGSAGRAYRDYGLEAPWLLAWEDGRVLLDRDGRYLYAHQVPGLYGGDRRGRGGRR